MPSTTRRYTQLGCCVVVSKAVPIPRTTGVGATASRRMDLGVVFQVTVAAVIHLRLINLIKPTYVLNLVYSVKLQQSMKASCQVRPAVAKESEFAGHVRDVGHPE